jgi:hypothetical protein
MAGRARTLQSLADERARAATLNRDPCLAQVHTHASYEYCDEGDAFRTASYLANMKQPGTVHRCRRACWHTTVIRRAVVSSVLMFCSSRAAPAAHTCTKSSKADIAMMDVDCCY